MDLADQVHRALKPSFKVLLFLMRASSSLFIEKKEKGFQTGVIKKLYGAIEKSSERIAYIDHIPKGTKNLRPKEYSKSLMLDHANDIVCTILDSERIFAYYYMYVLFDELEKAGLNAKDIKSGICIKSLKRGIESGRIDIDPQTKKELGL